MKNLKLTEINLVSGGKMNTCMCFFSDGNVNLGDRDRTTCIGWCRNAYPYKTLIYVKWNEEIIKKERGCCGGLG